MRLIVGTRTTRARRLLFIRVHGTTAAPISVLHRGQRGRCIQLLLCIGSGANSIRVLLGGRDRIHLRTGLNRHLYTNVS